MIGGRRRAGALARATGRLGVVLGLAVAPGVGGAQVAASRPVGAVVTPPLAFGEPVVVDGRVSASEWEGARSVDLPTGTLLLQERDGFLELALRTPPLFVASLCVQSGDAVHVLHASAAVGRASYTRGADGWALVHEFDWQLRGTGDGPAPRAEHDRYLAAEGWVANTVPSGTPGETEFRIALDRFGRDGLRLAVGLMLDSEDAAIRGWPVPAEADGCTRRSTIAGPPRAQETFEPGDWLAVERAPR